MDEEDKIIDYDEVDFNSEKEPLSQKRFREQQYELYKNFALIKEPRYEDFVKGLGFLNKTFNSRNKFNAKIAEIAEKNKKIKYKRERYNELWSDLKNSYYDTSVDSFAVTHIISSLGYTVDEIKDLHEKEKNVYDNLISNYYDKLITSIKKYLGPLLANNTLLSATLAFFMLDPSVMEEWNDLAENGDNYDSKEKKNILKKMGRIMQSDKKNADISIFKRIEESEEKKLALSTEAKEKTLQLKDAIKQEVITIKKITQKLDKKIETLLTPEAREAEINNRIINNDLGTTDLGLDASRDQEAISLIRKSLQEYKVGYDAMLVYYKEQKEKLKKLEKEHNELLYIEYEHDSDQLIEMIEEIDINLGGDSTKSELLDEEWVKEKESSYHKANDTLQTLISSLDDLHTGYIDDGGDVQRVGSIVENRNFVIEKKSNALDNDYQKILSIKYDLLLKNPLKKLSDTDPYLGGDIDFNNIDKEILEKNIGDREDLYEEKEEAFEKFYITFDSLEKEYKKDFPDAKGINDFHKKWHDLLVQKKTSLTETRLKLIDDYEKFHRNEFEKYVEKFRAEEKSIYDKEMEAYNNQVESNQHEKGRRLNKEITEILDKQVEVINELIGKLFSIREEIKEVSDAMIETLKGMGDTDIDNIQKNALFGIEGEKELLILDQKYNTIIRSMYEKYLVYEDTQKRPLENNHEYIDFKDKIDDLDISYRSSLHDSFEEVNIGKNSALRKYMILHDNRTSIETDDFVVMQVSCGEIYIFDKKQLKLFNSNTSQGSEAVLLEKNLNLLRNIELLSDKDSDEKFNTILTNLASDSKRRDSILSMIKRSKKGFEEDRLYMGLEDRNKATIDITVSVDLHDLTLGPKPVLQKKSKKKLKNLYVKNLPHLQLSLLKGSIDISVYDYVEFFSEGLAKVKTKKGERGFINKRGEIVVKPQYDDVRSFSEGLAAVRTKEGRGFINNKGEWIIEPRYDNVESFSEGLAAVKAKEGERGFINNKGEWIIEPEYNNVRSFSEGLAAVKTKEGERGFINKEGEMVIEPGHTHVGSFSEGLAVKTKEGERGFINNKGEWIIEPRYDNVEFFSEGLAAVKTKEGERGFINNKGEWIIEPEYNFVESFSEGLAVVKTKEGERGFINNKGEWIIEPRYDNVESFSEGMTKIKLGEKILLIVLKNIDTLTFFSKNDGLFLEESKDL